MIAFICYKRVKGVFERKPSVNLCVQKVRYYNIKSCFSEFQELKPNYI